MNRIDNIPSKVAIWLQPSLTPHRNPIRVGHLHFLSYIASLQTQSLAVLAICMHADNLIHALLLQRKQHQGSNHALLPHEIAISMKCICFFCTSFLFFIFNLFLHLNFNNTMTTFLGWVADGVGLAKKKNPIAFILKVCFCYCKYFFFFFGFFYFYFRCIRQGLSLSPFWAYLAFGYPTWHISAQPSPYCTQARPWDLCLGW